MPHVMTTVMFVPMRAPVPNALTPSSCKLITPVSSLVLQDHLPSLMRMALPDVVLATRTAKPVPLLVSPTSVRPARQLPLTSLTMDQETEKELVTPSVLILRTTMEVVPELVSPSVPPDGVLKTVTEHATNVPLSSQDAENARTPMAHGHVRPVQTRILSPTKLVSALTSFSSTPIRALMLSISSRV